MTQIIRYFLGLSSSSSQMGTFLPINYRVERREKVALKRVHRFWRANKSFSATPPFFFTQIFSSKC
jgi:hypothetical protein